MADSDQITAWRLLLTVHSRLIAALSEEMETRCGLSLDWYEVLLYLHEAGGRRLRMHELAESLLLSRSAATRFVDRMEQAGLVCRETCADDRRGTLVALTDAGRAAFAAAAPIHLDGIERRFADLISGEEAAVMSAALRRVAEAAGVDRP